jgi:hypothetical protein
LDRLALPSRPVAEGAGWAGRGTGAHVFKEINEQDGRGDGQLNDAAAFERDLIELSAAAVVEHNRRQARNDIVNRRNAEESLKFVSAEGKCLPGKARRTRAHSRVRTVGSLVLLAGKAKTGRLGGWAGIGGKFAGSHARRAAMKGQRQ